MVLETLSPVSCLIVHVFPEMYAYSGTEGAHLMFLLGPPHHNERETLLFVVMLVGMGVAGSGALNTIALVP